MTTINFVPRYRPMPEVSRGEINRCGEHLVSIERAAQSGDFDLWQNLRFSPGTRRATRIVDEFRAAHQLPLGKTSVGLRQFVKTSLHQEPAVSQRLKRLPRIIRKLANMDSSMLARLEDIGGTRAVVPTLADQERLCDHIDMRWGATIRRHRDYVAEPKASGYRARHFVVERDGRRIEIQVRTKAQQRWANLIEHADSRFDMTLKDGVGPESMLEYFTAAGAMLYFDEARTPPPHGLEQRFLEATERVIEEGYFVRRGSA